MALRTVAFALMVSNLVPTDPCVFTCLQAVLDGIARDERTDNIIGIMLGAIYMLISPIDIQLTKSPPTSIL